MVLVWELAGNGMQNSNEIAGEPARLPLLGVVKALLVVLVLEGLALVSATVFFVVELLVATPTSFASAVFIVVLLAIGAVWVGFVIRGVVAGAAWTRAAVVVIQVLFVAVAVGSLQGENARPDVAFGLLVPAIVGFVLVFRKGTVAHLSERGSDTAF